MALPATARPFPADWPFPAARSVAVKGSDAAIGSVFRSVSVPARSVVAHPVLFTPAALLPVELVGGKDEIPATVHRHRRPASVRHRCASDPAVSAAAPLLLTMVLMMVAALVAPERPGDQEAICQRHNGEAACRVW